MAHPEQREMLGKIRAMFPEKFTNCSVLDIGSLDINGNNRWVFSDYSYIGVDVGPGKNVDVVSKGHEYTSDQLFDIVISTECFEHDMYYPLTLNNCARLTKPGGMFIFTCATTGRAEHGTRRTRPQDAPLLDGEWGDYYKNLTEEDIRAVLDIDSIFVDYRFYVDNRNYDLSFWGIKHS